MCGLGTGKVPVKLKMKQHNQATNCFPPLAMPDDSALTFPISSFGSLLEKDLGTHNRRRLESAFNRKISRAWALRDEYDIEHKFGMIYVVYLGSNSNLESAVLHRDGAAFNIFRWFAGKDHKDTIDARGQKVKSLYNLCLDDLRARWYNVVPEFDDLLTDETKEYEPLV